MKETFFSQAMIYLAAAVIMVPVARKLALGSVLGYLLAGILIGPACFRLIGMEGHDLMHFAEFGVVMMLFIIGLELEPSRLWRLRKSIAGLGGLQVSLTAALVAGLVMPFGVDWKQSLALGLIVAMSSTAIVVQSLNEKGLMNTEAGRSSFAVLLFQDISVIPILAVFPLLVNKALVPAAGASGAQAMPIDRLPAWQHGLIVLLSMAVVIVAGRYLLRPVFRIIAKTGLREMFTAMGLLLVVAIAVLMTYVGLSPALGAFLAGVVLANSEYRHELEAAVDPFKGLLLGLFFIAVGASIDFSLILSRPWLILGLVVVLMLCKTLVLLLLGRVFGLSKPQNLSFSIGLSQVGEFAFVLLSFSAQEGILPAGITDTMVAVVAISMALTPLAVAINEKLILPRICNMTPKEARQSDVMQEENPVIVAGAGQFGIVVTRFLRANKVSATVLDIDSDRVDSLRRMGIKVYYGDATRADLLEIAGAGKAKMIVVAIGNEGKRLELIETVKKHFPDLQMLVRASDRIDAYNLMNAGMLHIYRDTVDTSLRMGVDALRLLGFEGQEASRKAKTFFLHDERTLKRLSTIRNEDEYLSAIRENIQELELILQADRDAGPLRADEPMDGQPSLAGFETVEA